MDNVKKLYPKNAAEDPDNVLEQAIGKYKQVIIVGWDKDEYLDVRSSTNICSREILWLLQLVSHKILDGDYNIDG